jgi:hypothetical protein
LHDGANFAVDELKKHGIDVDVIWDAPPQANIDDQNRRIEAEIGRRSQEQNWHPRASVRLQSLAEQNFGWLPCRPRRFD